MPDTRNALFVLVAGAGFFLAMHQWVTMIAETLPWLVAPCFGELRFGSWPPWRDTSWA